MGPIIRSRRIEGTFKSLRSGAQPGPTVSLLTPGLPEGGSSDQRLPRRGPAIRMRLVGIIHLQVLPQTAFEVLDRPQVPSFEKPAGQNGAPPFDLLKPRTVDGCARKDMRMVRVTQESAALYTALQPRGLKR